jgi:hypothetical protein
MRPRGRSPLAAGLLVVLAAGFHPAAHRAEPIVALRYAGGADGAPMLNELATIRAVGFDAVAWPDRDAVRLPDLRRMADIVGLTVVTLPAPVPLTAARARTPGAHVDVRVGEAEARRLTPLVWRAVAHGARSMAFDPGQTAGAGLTRADGAPAAWVAPAVAIARQLSANRRLVDVMRPGPAVTVDGADGADLDVVLLDGGRAWVIVATSLSAASVSARVTFPKGVPPGLWASWLDESAMSMLYRADGPVWTVTFDPFGTKVYFIDKNADDVERRRVKSAAVSILPTAHRTPR